MARNVRKQLFGLSARHFERPHESADAPADVDALDEKTVNLEMEQDFFCQAAKIGKNAVTRRLNV